MPEPLTICDLSVVYRSTYYVVQHYFIAVRMVSSKQIDKQTMNYSSDNTHNFRCKGMQAYLFKYLFLGGKSLLICTWGFDPQKQGMKQGRNMYMMIS